MAHVLPLELVTRSGVQPVQFEVRSAWNAGLAFRDEAMAERHRVELTLKGIDASKEGMTLFPLLPPVVRTDKHIEVIGKETSGEVEYALLFDGDRVYVAPASDHSDRLIETVTVQLSKLVCPNVISRQVWDYADVKDHWDDLILRSWVTLNGERQLYQEAPLAVLYTVDTMLDVLRSADALKDGLVFLSGTLPTTNGQLVFSDGWDMELHDPVLKRSLRHAYTITPLARRPGERYQKPLVAAR